MRRELSTEKPNDLLTETAPDDRLDLATFGGCVRRFICAERSFPDLFVEVIIDGGA
jgi:hypothetical protein